MRFIMHTLTSNTRFGIIDLVSLFNDCVNQWRKNAADLLTFANCESHNQTSGIFLFFSEIGRSQKFLAIFRF